jgi:hypothetical protein
VTAAKRTRAEQKYVVVLNDGSVLGTPTGLPLTRDGAWLLERYINEHTPELAPRAVKLTPYTKDADND